MAFQKGHKKVGGRQKGSENILTKELRVLLKNIMEDEIAAIPELLQELDPKLRLELLVKLLPFVVPKLNKINCKDGEPLQF